MIAGIAWFLLALHFLGTGLFGAYVAFIAGLIGGMLLFFPDAAFYWWRYLESKRNRKPDL